MSYAKLVVHRPSRNWKIEVAQSLNLVWWHRLLPALGLASFLLGSLFLSPRKSYDGARTQLCISYPQDQKYGTACTYTHLPHPVVQQSKHPSNEYSEDHQSNKHNEVELSLAVSVVARLTESQSSINPRKITRYSYARGSMRVVDRANSVAPPPPSQGRYENRESLVFRLTGARGLGMTLLVIYEV